MPRRVYVPPDHFLDNPSNVYRLGRRRGGQFAVAQNRYIVADDEQFLHLMGNVNDRYAVGFQIRNDSKESFSFRGRQCRCRFVHDQDANIVGKRFSDFDDLLLANAQVSHQGGGI